MTEMTTAAALPRTSSPVRRPGRTDQRRDHHRLALAVLLAGTVLIVVDFFIVNVALSSIRTSLHASTAALEWVVAGYGLTLAVFLVTAGRIGDRVGRRRVFGAGVAVFTAASAVCGLAPDATVLVIARLVQGVGAAMISPTVLALIGVLYAGAERARAIGIYATVMGVAAASGQAAWRRPDRTQRGPTRLAAGVPRQRPGRCTHPRRSTTMHPGVTRRTPRPHRRTRPSAAHAGADRARAAARRRPVGRMAGWPAWGVSSNDAGSSAKGRHLTVGQ